MVPGRQTDAEPHQSPGGIAKGVSLAFTQLEGSEMGDRGQHRQGGLGVLTVSRDEDQHPHVQETRRPRKDTRTGRLEAPPGIDD